MADNATLTIGDKSYDLQVIKGTTGPDVIDVRKLYADADVFTFDPGFTSTASCESKITYIDGDAGILLHRGYPIEQLAEKSSFLEVCYLLLNGELPTAAEFADFEHTITYHTMLHAQFDRFFGGFRSDAHPMAIMTGAVGALSAFYHDSTNVDDPEQREDLGAPADRQDADHRRPRLQVFDRPALRHRRATTSPTPKTSCAWPSRCRRRTGSPTRC